MNEYWLLILYFAYLHNLQRNIVESAFLPQNILLRYLLNIKEDHYYDEVFRNRFMGRTFFLDDAHGNPYRGK